MKNSHISQILHKFGIAISFDALTSSITAATAAASAATTTTTTNNVRESYINNVYTSEKETRKKQNR